MAASTLASSRVSGKAQLRARVSRQRTVVTKAAFELKPPPYPLDALESKGLSKESFEYHWGKHHQAYVTNLNNQLANKPDWEGKSLEEVIVASWNGGKPTPEFNNAAQIWNHTFLWESIGPNGGGAPTGKLADAITRDFGSFDEFKTQFKSAGATQFGSGWAWLVTDKSGKLSISKTANAETPIAVGQTPILTVDVWEHAYYIDFRNARPAYLDKFVNDLIDWSAVAQRYEAACA
jgi:Fe-Mn family superoxide dismutase